MRQFVTISKSDDQFWPMLTGRFSRTKFAQPVRNLYVNSVNETVTFKIIEKSSQSLLAALAHWYSLARHIYLVFPIVGGLSFLIASHGWPDPYLVLSSFFSLQFFLMSLILYNDYSDYVRGVDRINEYSSRKPLVQGLIRPFQARQLSLLFFFLSCFVGAYCFVQRPQALLFAFLALMVGFVLTGASVGHKLKGLSIFTTFLLAGPLLVVGYEFLLYQQVTFSSVILGFVFGLHALKYDFCNQVRDIFYSSKAQIITVSTFFGFEKSKFLYSFLSFAHLAALVYFCFLVKQKEIFFLVVVAFFFEAYMNRLIFAAASFLSSNISYCMSLQKLHYSIESSLFVVIFLSPLWLSFL